MGRVAFQFLTTVFSDADVLHFALISATCLLEKVKYWAERRALKKMRILRLCGPISVPGILLSCRANEFVNLQFHTLNVKSDDIGLEAPLSQSQLAASSVRCPDMFGTTWRPVGMILKLTKNLLNSRTLRRFPAIAHMCLFAS